MLWAAAAAACLGTCCFLSCQLWFAVALAATAVAATCMLLKSLGELEILCRLLGGLWCSVLVLVLVVVEVAVVGFLVRAMLRR